MATFAKTISTRQNHQQPKNVDRDIELAGITLLIALRVAEFLKVFGIPDP